MSERPQTNRRFVLRSRPAGLPDDGNFEIETLAIVPPCGDELLIRVLVAALSPWQNQRLKDFKNYTNPFRIGELIDCDVLGQVIAGESGGFAPGVLVTGRLGWQEFAIARSEQLTAATAEFADTLWLTALSSPGLTAYCAMDLFGRPMPGQTLVVTSAAGAVGGYAVQLGKQAGMRVVGIAGGSEKCALVMERLGADICLDHRRQGLDERLGEACPDGVHLFFDTVGGGVADAVFHHLAKYATVLIVGRTVSNNSDRPDIDPVNMRQLWAREATIHCFSRYSYPERWSFARARMMQLCRDGRIRAVEQVVEGFERTPAALRDMLNGKYMGKVLVRYAHADDNLGGLR
ncbi:MAG: NADP-dependent oxidoreductase [Proteobacteria bacterium]|nr:NADP-dependent oxidoreductase [Pseudomonadota bacterium]